MFEIQNLTWCRWRPTSSILTTILRASYRFGRAHLFDIDTRILVIMSFPHCADDVGNITVRASDPTMLSGFDSSTTDRTCFDCWDDGDGAFSVTNTNQARGKGR
jgi:hypothetical protein